MLAGSRKEKVQLLRQITILLLKLPVLVLEIAVLLLQFPILLDELINSLSRVRITYVAAIRCILRVRELLRFGHADSIRHDGQAHDEM